MRIKHTKYCEPLNSQLQGSVYVIVEHSGNEDVFNK